MTASKSEHISISRSNSSNDDLDFLYLKELGIAYLQAMSGKLWTDFNEHDPGLTMLEVLCYAITDLSNRIAQPIEDVLSREDGSLIARNFIEADRILPARPCTETDYRKLIIDLKGVRNCWLENYEKEVYINYRDKKMNYSPFTDASIHPNLLGQFKFRGLFSFLIDTESELTDAEFETLKTEIRKRYHENRNLCEDLIEIKRIETQPICVCAVIELDDEADEDRIDAEVRFAIEEYFAPSMTFRTLKEQLNLGISTDELFEGPLLDHGFISDADLEKASLRPDVRLSDLVKCIGSIKGVKLVSEITMKLPNDASNIEQWLIPIAANKKAKLCDDSMFTFHRSVLPAKVNRAKAKEYYDLLKQQQLEKNRPKDQSHQLDSPRGRYLELSDYSSVQNDFPDVYGIGFNGLSEKVSTARKSQAKQLQAFLLFFDQILASYFAQLEEVKFMLSHDVNPKFTYFTQAVTDFYGQSVLAQYSSDPDVLHGLLLKDYDSVSERKNQFYDHLLARFGEQFSSYAILLKQQYGAVNQQVLADTKFQFLGASEHLSKNRGGSFNYLHRTPEELWDTTNVSGFEKRIGALIGLHDCRRRNLSDSSPAEIYSFVNSDSETVFRWRIRNSNGEILASATENYPNADAALEEMYFVVRQIHRCDESLVEELDHVSQLADETQLGNFLIQKASSGRYSIDIINDQISDPDDPDRIIARQYRYVSTVEELKIELLELIRFVHYEFEENGMFVVEHILLRPDVNESTVSPDLFLPVNGDTADSCCCNDPYSYRLSIILPGYTAAFSDLNIRNFVENLIREELPAHILPRICWIGDRKTWIADNSRTGDYTGSSGDSELSVFEKNYKAFLMKRTESEQAHPAVELEALLESMKNLHSIYPAGRLIHCSDEDGKDSPPIILGRTNLGTI